MNGYTKLFSSIITSTVWREPKEVKILWITMLALADKYGEVAGSVPGLAAMAGLGVEETRAALLALESPDLDSRTKDEEGRRVRPIDGGWVLINHAKYREMMNADDRKEYLRKKQAEYRERVSKRKQQNVSIPVTDVSDTSTPSTHAECRVQLPEAGIQSEGAAAPAVAKPKVPPRMPTLDEWCDRAKENHPDWPRTDAESAWHHYESVGWKKSKGVPIVKWGGCVATCYNNWKSRGGAGLFHETQSRFPMPKLSN